MYGNTGSTLNDATGNNKNCKVDHESGTGYGQVSGGYGERVTTATWDECQDAINGA